MADDAGTVQDKDQWIYVPEPDGYKRASLVFPGNVPFVVDCELDDLVQQFGDFLAGKEQLLRLTDVGNGYPTYLTRKGAENVLFVRTEWVKNAPPPRPAGGRLTVARDVPPMPREIRRHQGRR